MTELERRILELIAGRKVTGLQVLEFFCPPPRWPELEVKDAICALIERGEVKEWPDRTLEKTRKAGRA